MCGTHTCDPSHVPALRILLAAEVKNGEPQCIQHTCPASYSPGGHILRGCSTPRGWSGAIRILVIDAETRPQQLTKRRYLKIGLRRANSYATLGHLRVHLERRNLAIGMSWQRPDARRSSEQRGRSDVCDDLAELLVRFEVAVGFHDLLERECLVDQRRERSVGESI
jgi:hypothetical protein